MNDFDLEVRFNELEKRAKEQERLITLLLKHLDLYGPDDRKV